MLYILELSRIYAVSLLTYMVLLFYAYSCTSAPVPTLLLYLLLYAVPIPVYPVVISVIIFKYVLDYQ